MLVVEGGWPAAKGDSKSVVVGNQLQRVKKRAPVKRAANTKSPLTLSGLEGAK